MSGSLRKSSYRQGGGGGGGGGHGLDCVEDLKNNINSTHEDFLREDDVEKKGDHWRFLCSYATQFLHLVPHDKKFLLKETERVLHQSAMNIGEFDPREASLAFESLAKYAQNMLDQPWRKDFRTIKLTSGYYVHNVAAQLRNAHEILVAMGYVHVDETTLEILPQLNEKRVKDVSRDMIVASQECLVLSQIWQRVADEEPDYPLTIGEVFEFRSKYVGDTSTLCSTMLNDIRRRHHHHRMQQITKSTTGRNYVPVDKLIDYEDNMDTLDHKDRGTGEKIRELEIVQKVLHNTKIMNDGSHTSGKKRGDHIYDQVCNDSEQTNGRRHNPNYQSYGHHQDYPYHPAGSAFVTTTKQDYRTATTGPGASWDYDRDSPLIPKTVASFDRQPYIQNSRSHTSAYTYQPHPQSNSSSLSSSSIGKPSRHSVGNTTSMTGKLPLQFSKVQPDLDEMACAAPAHNHRRKSETTGSTIAWSEWASNGEVNYPPSSDPHQRQFDSNRSRRPIMPNDVYPDDYFPRVVKPVPQLPHIHSSPTVNGNLRRTDRTHEDLDIRERNGLKFMPLNFDEDTSIATSVSGFTREELDTDLRSLSSAMSLSSDGDGDRRPHAANSMNNSPSWDVVDSGTIEKRKRVQDNGNYPSQRRQTDGAHVNGRDYRDRGAQSSSSSSGNAEIKKATNSLGQDKRVPDSNKHLESLDSLETVYYNQLVRNGGRSDRDDLDSSKKHDISPKREVSVTYIKSPGDEPTSDKIRPWNCPFCTFKNKKNDKICEVCAKSRDFILEEEEDEESPTISSPPSEPTIPKLYSQPNSPLSDQPTPTSPSTIACTMCTLENRKTRFECEACGQRLRNASSPKGFF